MMRRIISWIYIVSTIALSIITRSNVVCAQNALSIESAHYPSGTTEIEVPVTLSNEDSVWGIMFDVIDTPNVLTGDTVSSALEDQDYLMFGNDLEFAYRVILMNLSLGAIPPAPQQLIATISYTVESDFDGIITLEFSNVQMLDDDGNELDIDPSEGVITITIGRTNISGETIGERYSPSSPELAQNSPNPFNAGTAISFSLPEQAMVSITVYNLLGQKVDTLIESALNAGHHTVFLNSQNNPSGVYHYILRAGSVQKTRRMLLLR